MKKKKATPRWIENPRHYLPTKRLSMKIDIVLFPEQIWAGIARLPNNRRRSADSSRDGNVLVATILLNSLTQAVLNVFTNIRTALLLGNPQLEIDTVLLIVEVSPGGIGSIWNNPEEVDLRRDVINCLMAPYNLNSLGVGIGDTGTTSDKNNFATAIERVLVSVGAVNSNKMLAFIVEKRAGETLASTDDKIKSVGPTN
jgi:hypothetical protein